MKTTTKIQLADHTFNPWREVGDTRVMANVVTWREPVKWNKAAEKEGVRRRVFLPDVFEDWQGEISDSKGNIIRKLTGDPECMIDRGPATMNDLRRDLFAVIDATPNLDWIILTKHPQNVRAMWPDFTTRLWGDQASPVADVIYRGISVRRPNVWLLASISDQATADAMVPELLKCRDLVSVLGVSAEPLLGAVELWPWLTPKVCDCGDRGEDTDADYLDQDCECYPGNPLIDWVIIGGESGPHARPCNVTWIRSLVAQCTAAGVPAFVKQLGSNLVSNPFIIDPKGRDAWPERTQFRKEYHRDIGEFWCVDLKDPKGGDPDEWLEDLRVIEMPEVQT